MIAACLPRESSAQLPLSFMCFFPSVPERGGTRGSLAGSAAKCGSTPSMVRQISLPHVLLIGCIDCYKVQVVSSWFFSCQSGRLGTWGTRPVSSSRWFSFSLSPRVSPAVPYSSLSLLDRDPSSSFLSLGPSLALFYFPFPFFLLLLEFPPQNTHFPPLVLVTVLAIRSVPCRISLLSFFAAAAAAAAASISIPSF